MALGWLESKLRFDQTSLNEIIAELEMVFGKKIKLSDPQLGKLTVTASFKEQDFQSVLKSICLTLDLQYRKEKETFIIFK